MPDSDIYNILLEGKLCVLTNFNRIYRIKNSSCMEII